MARILCWFSHGAASAVAVKLMIGKYGREVIPIKCDTGAEHKDNGRFGVECEEWWGIKFQTIKSEKYTDTWDVWEKTRWLAGIKGARCTAELKIIPRLDFQKPDDIHVFGYTSDKADKVRAAKVRENFFDLTIETPLIDFDLDKAACLAMLSRAGIELPAMYKLGYLNNNCIPCVKATSPAYWALVRKTHPAEFERMAKLSRSLNVRLCRLNNERRFIDEIPDDFPIRDPLVPACDLLCQIIEGNFDNGQMQTLQTDEKTAEA